MKRIQYVSSTNNYEQLHKVVWVASVKDESGEYLCPTQIVDLDTNELVQPDGSWFCDGINLWQENPNG